MPIGVSSSIAAFADVMKLENKNNSCEVGIDELNVCIHNNSFICHKIGDKLFDCDRCMKLHKKKSKGLALSKQIGKAVDTLIRWIEPRIMKGDSPYAVEQFIIKQFSITDDMLSKYYDRIDIVRPDLSIRKLKEKTNSITADCDNM